jgi:hypothetical protein
MPTFCEGIAANVHGYKWTMDHGHLLDGPRSVELLSQ